MIGFKQIEFFDHTAEIVRMALEQIDWPPADPHWFWILWWPLPCNERSEHVASVCLAKYSTSSRFLNQG